MSHPEYIFLGLGSNLGASQEIVNRAANLIASLEEIQLFTLSSLYRTTPLSSLAQADFINAACMLQTSLSPPELYDALHQIELLLGKTPKPKEAPRLIDIDILLYEQLILDEEGLILPHKGLRSRDFVIQPLLDIDPRCIDPVSGRLLSEFLAEIPAEDRYVLRQLKLQGSVIE